ncbi:MAG: FtsH protease activity modulator HflK, partial [Holosporaceae bacterium]|nr:FtsH protease activity modulator HflK [Holosporaceae bacterium]
WDGNDNPGKKKPGEPFFSEYTEKIKKTADGLNGGGGERPSVSVLVYSAMSIVFLLYLASGFYQVQHDQRGVVLRFGKWVRTVGPGLQYILPYPFESVILQKVTKVNQTDIGSFFKNQQEESLVLTGDSNLANISFSVLWKIKENGVEDYLFNAKSPEITVRAVAESVMREIVGQTPFTYIQTEGRGDIQRKVRENLQLLMDEYKTGVEIVRVELQRVEPPASVIDSFRDVERAQAEQQSEKNKADAYDRDTRARTRGLIAEKINRGEAVKRSVAETARGAVARFLSALSQYKIAPNIMSKRLYIETMRDIYKDATKIIIDDDVKSIPHLPLTKVLKIGKEETQEK